MLDPYKREITYFRISVTDKCNLRCRYCMPEEGITLRKHVEFLTFEQIRDITAAAADLGITKVRLTGGEPLVKRGIEKLVGLIHDIRRIEHIGMTTNGVLLAEYMTKLIKNGLSSVNISLDTLDPERYTHLTRGGDISHVLGGIDAAAESNIPVKLNMVILEDTPEKEVDRMKAFCIEKGLKLQFIGHYSLFQEKRDSYTFDRPPDCSQCNRLRLLADGKLKPCLHSDIEIPVDFSDIKKSIIQAISSKPEHGTTCTHRNMVEIGG